MHEEFDPTDYSVVVKLRGNPPKAWKWEIYRAGRWGPLESSPVFFESMAVAAKEGKKALARLLAKAKHAAYRPCDLLAAHANERNICHGQPQSYVHLRRDLRGDRNQRLKRPAPCKVCPVRQGSIPAG
jgi:hypothetical protein